MSKPGIAVWFQIGGEHIKPANRTQMLVDLETAIGLWADSEAVSRVIVQGPPNWYDAWLIPAIEYCSDNGDMQLIAGVTASLCAPFNEGRLDAYDAWARLATAIADARLSLPLDNCTEYVLLDFEYAMHPYARGEYNLQLGSVVWGAQQIAALGPAIWYPTIMSSDADERARRSAFLRAVEMAGVPISFTNSTRARPEFLGSEAANASQELMDKHPSSAGGYWWVLHWGADTPRERWDDPAQYLAIINYTVENGDWAVINPGRELWVSCAETMAPLLRLQKDATVAQ